MKRCIALPVCHALTGCDFNSAVKGVGKKTAWNIWENNWQDNSLESLKSLTNALIQLTNNPEALTIQSPVMDVIQCFFIIFFCKKIKDTEINKVREVMFTTGLKTMDTIPPTLNTL